MGWKENKAAKNAERSRRYNAERRAWVNSFKDKPCTDCGGSFPVECMDFDHLRDKSFSIGLEKRRSKEILLAEMAKCEIVCANCHRIRTKRRLHQNA